MRLAIRSAIDPRGCRRAFAILALPARMTDESTVNWEVTYEDANRTRAHGTRWLNEARPSGSAPFCSRPHPSGEHPRPGTGDSAAFRLSLRRQWIAEAAMGSRSRRLVRLMMVGLVPAAFLWAEQRTRVPEAASRAGADGVTPKAALFG